MARAHSPRIVIVGGGASGVLLAAHLLRAGGDAVDVTIVEREGKVGRGLAYGTTHPDHLLNVRAANMSAFADEPDHLLEWLAANDDLARPHPATAFRFVQRRVYGHYLSSLIEPHLSGRNARANLRVVHGEAVALDHDSDSVTVQLADGRQLDADAVVLATGNEPRLQYGPGETHESPWVPLGEAGVRQNARIAIRGTGLTMIDYALSLVAHGHVGPIIAISRRGKLPQVHRSAEPLQLARADVPLGAGMLALWRWFRNYIRDSAKAGHDWRAAVDAIRPHSWELWSRLPLDARQRFLRHARVWWEIHRHRMAPDAEARIQRLIATGQLQIVAATITNVASTREGLFVNFRRRGEAIVETVRVNRFVDCSGISSDPLQSNNPFVVDLLDKGLARPDPLSLGFDVDRSWALIDADGVPSRRLYAIGPLTRATAWETVAVPDIRVQCAELAARLLRAGASQTSSTRDVARGEASI